MSEAKPMNANAGASCWTMEEIELYHDGELEPARAAELDAALATDADLCRRLARVRALDHFAGVTLRTAPMPAPTRARAGLLRWGAGLVVVAALLALMLLPARVPVSFPSPTPGPVVSIDPPIRSSVPELLDAAGVKVLASFEVVKPKRSSPSRPPRSLAFEPETPVVTEPQPAALSTQLASGDVDGALASLRSATPAQRDAALSTIGATLRSAMTVESVLDKLSPAEQLDVCAVWAREPRLRPVTFARLAQLQSNPELRDRVAALASQLAESRELLAWVRSYGLRTPGALPQAG